MLFYTHNRIINFYLHKIAFKLFQFLFLVYKYSMKTTIRGLILEKQLMKLMVPHHKYPPMNIQIL